MQASCFSSSWKKKVEKSSGQLATMFLLVATSRAAAAGPAARRKERLELEQRLELQQRLERQQRLELRQRLELQPKLNLQAKVEPAGLKAPLQREPPDDAAGQTRAVEGLELSCGADCGDRPGTESTAEGQAT